MKGRFFQIILSFLFLMSFTLQGNAEPLGRSYPLLMVEVEKILIQWLFHSGFKVTRRDLEGFQVQLEGVKENETWELTLRPLSPLWQVAMEIQSWSSGSPVFDGDGN